MTEAIINYALAIVLWCGYIRITAHAWWKGNIVNNVVDARTRGECVYSKPHNGSHIDVDECRVPYPKPKSQSPFVFREP